MQFRRILRLYFETMTVALSAFSLGVLLPEQQNDHENTR
jgi:hypothetical protein